MPNTRILALRQTCPGGGGVLLQLRPGVRFRAGMLPDVAEVKSDLPCPLQPPQQAKAACRGCSPPAPIHRWRLQPWQKRQHGLLSHMCTILRALQRPSKATDGAGETTQPTYCLS